MCSLLETARVSNCPSSISIQDSTLDQVFPPYLAALPAYHCIVPQSTSSRPALNETWIGSITATLLLRTTPACQAGCQARKGPRPRAHLSQIQGPSVPSYLPPPEHSQPANPPSSAACPESPLACVLFVLFGAGARRVALQHRKSPPLHPALSSILIPKNAT